jgi:hypothetical protein
MWGERNTECWLAIKMIGPERVLDIGPEHSPLFVHRDNTDVLDVSDLQQSRGISRGNFVDSVRFGDP